MKDDVSKDGQGVHPLLRGGQPIPEHQLSKPEIVALTAICDTIFPSVDFIPHGIDHEGEAGGKTAESRREVLESYFRLSASDANIPLEVAGYINKLFKRSVTRRIHWALWLFSSRIGTLLLGGRLALTSTFPFLCNFAQLPLERREKVLFGLSRSCFYLWQEVFRCFKCFICWIIFTQVDKHGDNPTFEALGYKVGEDEEEEQQPRQPQPQHLPGRVINARSAGIHLGAELAKLGIPLLTDVAPLRALLRHPTDSGVAVEVGVHCDVVVLGSGPGGAVVAAQIAKAGHRVLVLEKGDYFSTSEFSQLEGPSMYAMYEESGCLITDDSRMILLAGATVGGGSTINWSASFRTPNHVLSEWAHSHDLPLFASATYVDAMDAICSRLGVQSNVAHENLQNSALRTGATALGYHVDTIPRNSPPDHHCGFCGLGCRQGKKLGATTTWLEDAATLGAVVVARCRAEEVLTRRVDGGGQRRQVVGVAAEVEVIGHSKRVKVYVEASVVVAACGALRTPSLLRWSGLSNRAIGRNLHIHPVQIVWGYFPPGVSPPGQCYSGGIMTAYSTVAANWDSNGYGALIQCLSSQPGVIGLTVPWVSGADFKTRMQKFARTTFFIVLTRDQGSGQVDVDSHDRLRVLYKLSDADKESLHRGAESGLRILLAAGASEVGTFNSDGGTFVPIVKEDKPFENFLQEVRLQSFNKLSTIVVSAHQMGSCRMGAHPSSSAVDSSGETWEVRGLFVADSSVFPTASGVNPMITVQSIAYCTAQSILCHLKHH